MKWEMENLFFLKVSYERKLIFVLEIFKPL